MEEKNCPICKNIFKDTFLKTSRTSYDICLNCGVIFENPPSDYVEYKNYGRINPDLEEKKFCNISRKAILDKFFYPNKKTLLEVGCAYGTFLDLMKKDNWNIIGVEPSKNQYEISKQFNLNIYNDFFDKKLFFDKKFEVICFFHVLEHMKDPYLFLNQVYDLLEDDGVIFLEVPDTYRPALNDLDKLYTLGHYIMYDINNLSILLNNCGFKVVISENINCGKRGFLSVIACKKKNIKQFNQRFYEKTINSQEYSFDFKKIREKIEGKRIALFGFNFMTERLLKKIPDIQVEVIIDSFSEIEEYNNIKIDNLENISNYSFENIIIVSFNSQDKIYNLLKNKIDSEKIIKLFDEKTLRIPKLKNNKEYFKYSQLVFREMFKDDI